MNRHLVEPIDQIDAAVFTGDTFLDDDERKEFRQILARWERKLIEWDELSLELKDG